jgi:RimJ/RimL family protein N-acetyltransferase
MIMNIPETERLVMRPWRDQDAASLYEYARDPRVGPRAGWPVHTSVENSLDIIRGVLSAEGIYAITIRPDDRAVGSIGLMIGTASNLILPPNEGEIGYWIGVPFWGRGYTPEATKEMIRHGFEDLGLDALWCGWFDGNSQSRRVGEKCGFRHVRSGERYWPLIDKTMLQHVSRLTRREWENTKK